jgi:hypothetical protein
LTMMTKRKATSTWGLQTSYSSKTRKSTSAKWS